MGHKSYCFLAIHFLIGQRVSSVDESVVLSRFVVHIDMRLRSGRSYDKNVMGTADELCRVPFLGFRYKMVRVNFLCLLVLHNFNRTSSL